MDDVGSRAHLPVETLVTCGDEIVVLSIDFRLILFGKFSSDWMKIVTLIAKFAAVFQEKRTNDDWVTFLTRTTPVGWIHFVLETGRYAVEENNNQTTICCNRITYDEHLARSVQQQQPPTVSYLTTFLLLGRLWSGTTTNNSAVCAVWTLDWAGDLRLRHSCAVQRRAILRYRLADGAILCLPWAMRGVGDRGATCR